MAFEDVKMHLLCFETKGEKWFNLLVFEIIDSNGELSNEKKMKYIIHVNLS